ncbi:MAG: hypothetical protein ABIF08_01995 [Nanoarchaeota archaeon]
MGLTGWSLIIIFLLLLIIMLFRHAERKGVKREIEMRDRTAEEVPHTSSQYILKDE